MKLNENERIDYIFDQQMPIIQSPDVFSFSLDAVILAYYTRISKRTKVIVDLCSGNGAVGTFLTRRTDSLIIEIELQAKLADMAKRTAILNHVEDRIKILNIDLKDSLKYLNHDSVDVLCCNPPYFKVTPSAKQNPNRTLAISRHELETNLSEILSISKKILKSGGKAFFIHRPERLTEILEEFKKNNLGINHLKFIHSFQNTTANMVFIEAIKGKSSEGINIDPPLYIYEQEGIYTKEMSKIIHG